MKAAKEHARESADSAGDQVGSFDIRQQVDAHPWASLGVAVLSGYVLGSMGGSSSDDSPRSDTHQRDHNAPRQADELRPPTPPAPPQDKPQPSYKPQPVRHDGPRVRAQNDQRGGILGLVIEQFGGELRTLTTAAVGTAVSALRDTLKESVPQFAYEYERRHQDGGLGRTATPLGDAPPVDRVPGGRSAYAERFPSSDPSI